MPLWPLKISVRNVSLPITFMTTQGLNNMQTDCKLLQLFSNGDSAIRS